MLKTCFDQSPYYTLARDFYENEPLKLRTLRKTWRARQPSFAFYARVLLEVFDGRQLIQPSVLDMTCPLRRRRFTFYRAATGLESVGRRIVSSKDRIKIRDFSPKVRWQLLCPSERNAASLLSSMSQSYGASLAAGQGISRLKILHH
jgi:hypothetical protein